MKKKMAIQKLRQNILLAKQNVGKKNCLLTKFWKEKFLDKDFFGKIGFGAKKNDSKTKFYLKIISAEKKNICLFVLTLSQNENKNCISATIRTH